MPAVNPRQPCACHAAPQVTVRFQEEAVGQAPFRGLLIAGLALGAAHLFAAAWGWVGWVVLGALDVLWALMFWLFTDEVLQQRRYGLGYAELDGSDLNYGGKLALRIGSDRGLGGLTGLTVWLRCVDTFRENREVGDDGRTELVDACYVVWEDRRIIDADALLASREARVEFALPEEGDLAGPWGTWKSRAWAVEAERHGGPLPLRFCVMVGAPK